MRLAVFLPLLILAAGAQAETEAPAEGPPVLTLEECVTQALRGHPNLEASLQAVRANRAKVGQALSGYLPQVEEMVTLQDVTSRPKTSSTSDSTGVVSGGSFSSRGGNVTSALSFRQLLWDFWKTPDLMSEAGANTKAARYDLAAKRQEVILAVKTAYYDVVKAQRSLGVAEETKAQARKHNEQAKGFYEVGTRPRFDVTKTEVEVANAEVQLIQARKDVQVSKVTLNNAVGARRDTAYRVEDLFPETPSVPEADEAVREALASRPELQAYRARARGLQANIRAQWKSYLPSVTGLYNYNTRDTEQTRLTRTWSVGLQGTVALDGIESAQKAYEQKANLEKLKAETEAEVLSVVLEVEQSRLNVLEAKERLGAAQALVKQARENLEIAEERYRTGAGSIIETTDAQVLLTEALQTHIEALADSQIALAELEKSMGRDARKDLGIGKGMSF